MKKTNRKLTAKYFAVLGALILVFICIMAVAIFGSGKDAVIARAGNKKILQSDYDKFIYVSSAMEKLQNVDAVIKGISIAGYLEDNGVSITAEDTEKEYSDLLGAFYSGGSAVSPYDVILEESGIDEEGLKSALRHVAAVNAAEKKLDAYISSSYKAQDTSSAEYTEDFSAYSSKLRYEAEAQTVSLNYGGGSGSINGVSCSYSDYAVYIDFSTHLNSYQLVEAVALYFQIAEAYGSNADTSGFSGYYDTVKAELVAEAGFKEAISNTGVSETEFFLSAQRFYKNVYIYEMLEDGYFLERYSNEDATLGHETYEDYLSFQLMTAASKCEVVKFIFED